MKKRTSTTNKNTHNYNAIDFYQKPILFAIFLSFILDLFAMYLWFTKRLTGTSHA